MCPLRSTLLPYSNLTNVAIVANMATVSGISQALLSKSHHAKSLRSVEKYLHEKEVATSRRRLNMTIVTLGQTLMKHSGEHCRTIVLIYFTTECIGPYALRISLGMTSSSTKLNKIKLWNLCIFRYIIMKITPAYYL